MASGGGLVTKSCLTVATPWTVACQAPLSMGFSRQEYWNGLPFLLQATFLIQELNPDLLHCRQILYWLSYKGNPVASVRYSINPLSVALCSWNPVSIHRLALPFWFTRIPELDPELYPRGGSGTSGGFWKDPQRAALLRCWRGHWIEFLEEAYFFSSFRVRMKGTMGSSVERGGVAGCSTVYRLQGYCECRFMCLMHRESKHAETLECGAETGLLQGPSRTQVIRALKSSEVPGGFQQSIFKSQVGRGCGCRVCDQLEHNSLLGWWWVHSIGP